MPLLRLPETFQNLGNQSEWPVGALKRTRRGTRATEKQYHRIGNWCWPSRSRLRPICCGVNDLVTALCAITIRVLGRGRGRGRREGIAVAWKQLRTSLIINFLRVIIMVKQRTAGIAKRKCASRSSRKQEFRVSRTFALRLFIRDSEYVRGLSSEIPR